MKSLLHLFALLSSTGTASITSPQRSSEATSIGTGPQSATASSHHTAVHASPSSGPGSCPSPPCAYVRGRTSCSTAHMAASPADSSKKICGTLYHLDQSC